MCIHLTDFHVKMIHIKKGIMKLVENFVSRVCNDALPMAF